LKNNTNPPERSRASGGRFKRYLGHLPDAEIEAMLNELAIGVLRTNLDFGCLRARSGRLKSAEAERDPPAARTAEGMGSS
jgi:hypothetical protein